MLIPSWFTVPDTAGTSLSRRVNANSQLQTRRQTLAIKLIKKGEC